MPEPYSSNDDFLDLESETREHSADEIDNQVAQAQERLLKLKRESEKIERAKQKLEEIGKRQDQFDTHRAEMVGKFTTSVDRVEREIEQMLRRLEILKHIQTEFTVSLQELEKINPSAWKQEPNELTKELSQAITFVEDAHSSYRKAQAQIGLEEDAADSPYESESIGGSHGFSYWLMAGFAFTLPICALLLLGLFFWFLQLASTPN